MKDEKLPDKMDFVKARKVFIKAIEKILKKDIENLPIPHKEFKETKKMLSEIIAEEKVRLTDADFVFDLPTSETEFLNVLLKYLPRPENTKMLSFALLHPYLRKYASEERTYFTPSGNIIRFNYK